MTDGGVVRLDPENEADMRYMLLSGLIWKADPAIQQQGIDALMDGKVDLDECENLPPAVRTEVEGILGVSGSYPEDDPDIIDMAPELGGEA